MSKRITDSSEHSNEEKITFLFNLAEAQEKVNQANLKDHARLQEIVKLLQDQIETLNYKVEGLNNGMHAMIKHGYRGGDC